MRVVWASSICLVLWACGGMMPVATYPPIGDLQTTTPRTLAEGGHGDPVQSPPGVSWVLALEGYEQTATEQASPRRFVMTVDLVDRRETDDRLARPVFDGAELVDDEGRRYACLRGSEPADDGKRKSKPGEPARARFELIFDLPSTYRFRSVTTLTVHWALQFGTDQVMPISSRFRS